MPISEQDSPGDKVAVAERWLANHPHAALSTRASFAVLVASGGVEEPDQAPTFGEVAAILGEPVDAVFDALYSLMD